MVCWIIVSHLHILFRHVVDQETDENSPNLHPSVLRLYRAVDGLPLWLIRLSLLWNIALALMPLLMRKDELIDVPLTPSQRALLGLDPNATPPATPETQYITPPRYPRSRTPISGTPASRGSSNINTPRSRNESPISGGNQVVDSFFPPGRSIGGARGERRNSYGLSSPLGVRSGGRDMSVFAPSTPSPPGGKAVGVPLNNRWLYERGRASSSSRSFH